MIALTFIAGLILLVLGAEALVRGASKIAAAAGISPLVIGLTIVAMGTSSPELAVSLGSALDGNADIALGNIVGSNIFNVLFILGLSSIILPLIVHQQLVRLDVPVMICTSLLVLILSWDEVVQPWEGAMLMLIGIFYTVYIIRKSRKERNKEVLKEYRDEYSNKLGNKKQVWLHVLFILAGLALLVFGARLLLDSAVNIATALGVSDLVIGLTIVAAGTSLPEVATSVIASLRKEADIAVGNVVGSNIFNILIILGLTALISPGGVVVHSAAQHFDIPFMIAVAIACLPFFFTGYTIKRWEGAMFLAYYAAYTFFLIVKSQQHTALPVFTNAMLWFVVPITVLTMIVVTVREVKKNKR